ncbi:hypothetical protein [Clostridium saccharobutylicum]|uniref:DUF2262 domain-containing protein n=1 Tax=Clostridium saccharobutylicum DSM 13864 TaxID=1345695 RepID=U5MLW8_CLOSA|nr:hypothetical protein [Clostridium saccharobutylicum]AGX41804.1 hypothetical protein CLSA_c07910 [Clostridium saccharobutylicum DSM 13864]AQR89080.1 hypothetical protein CLOSC_07760 [Clostridium saccharobutylicum]AQR98981.1 hypothetical protein CSACC_07830 [Clostridium saccharobutylicum]AQS12969.1 hypothetical protein CLOSACC_07830 [Clostridium saccharobutylicum]MBA2903913.1 hypothetical protein [Clostridium saccharobutylicum]
MESIIIEDNLMGKLQYKKENWNKIDPIKYYLNNEEKSIIIEIDIQNGEATEYELGIGGWEADDFDDDELDRHEEYKKQVKFMYKKYIELFSETIKLVRDIIIEDYNTFIQETSKEEVIRIIGEENYKCIANNKDKVFDLITLQKATIFNKRIRIIGECKWYINNEFGINLWKDDSYNIGNLDTIY